MDLQISSLVIYPIKSCGGITLERATLERSGLQGDRRYMLVDKEGRFLTGRQKPTLALVRLSQEGDLLKISAPGSVPLTLSAEPRPEPSDKNGSPHLEALVWDDRVDCFVHSEGSNWFSSYLKSEVRLVFLDPIRPRPINDIGGEPGDRLSLADGYPLLLTTETSLADLNQRLEHPVPMSRFRPNVVVKGSAPYAEDLWARLRLAKVEVIVPKLCKRCVFITVDASSGERNQEPLRTLSGYRRWNQGIWFGCNLIPRGVGILSVGDRVLVGEERPHPRSE